MGDETPVYRDSRNKHLYREKISNEHPPRQSDLRTFVQVLASSADGQYARQV